MQSDLGSCIDCQERPLARGMCARHYHQARRATAAGAATCSKCDQPRAVNSLCREHYNERIVAKIEANVMVDGGLDTGCWIWTGTIDRHGYGKLGYTGDGDQWRTEQSAYRVAYRLHVGPIPDGLTLDHLCRVRSCVRPDHLQPVTAMENTRRAWAAMPENPPPGWFRSGNRSYGSGSLREKRPGVWELRYAGRSRTVRGGRKEAERALAGMVSSSAGRRPVAVGVTLGKLVDEWLSSARIEASTRSTYETALAHLPPAARRLKLDALELRTFDRLYADLERAGVSRHQIRKLHTALSSALTTAVRWQYLGTNPARGAQLPELPHRQVKAPPTDVVVRLLQAAGDDIQATIWLRLALATGARRGEVLALRWTAVDLEQGTVNFAASMNEDRTVKVTKTNRERTIILDPGTLDALRSWRALQVSRALELGVKATRSCYVLSNALDGSIPWRPDGATQRFRRLRERAGVGNEVRLHDLRHANATLMLRNGVDPMTAAYRLGHSRPTTTMDIYGHVVDGADRAAADTIGRLLG